MPPEHVIPTTFKKLKSNKAMAEGTATLPQPNMPAKKTENIFQNSSIKKQTQRNRTNSQKANNAC